MNRYADLRARKLVQIAANNLPQDPEKAKSILNAVLADSRVVSGMDLLGGEIYEFIDKKEADSPQDQAEDRLEDDADSELLSVDKDSPQDQAEDKMDDASTTEATTSEERPLATVEESGGLGSGYSGIKERSLGEAIRTRLLEVASAARNRGKIGLARSLELSLSADLVQSLQELLMLELNLFDTIVAHSYLGVSLASMANISKLQSVIRALGSEPTLNRMVLQPLPDRSTEGLLAREKAIIGPLKAGYEDLLSHLDIANSVESELYLAIKSLEDSHAPLGEV